MKKFKGTEGEWFINYVSGIPIGVNAIIEELAAGTGTYSKNIVEPILPDDDESWENEKEETTANLKLISAAPELLELCQLVYGSLIYYSATGGGLVMTFQESDFEKFKQAIKKAL